MLTLAETKREHLEKQTKREASEHKMGGNVC
jgi:hypothetical protein